MTTASTPRLSLTHTLNLIREHQAEGTTPWAFIQGQRVLLKRDVLETFAVHGTRCRGCGLEATEFRLDPANDHGVPTRYKHLLHLYGERDGELVMFTQDHTVARALGGSNDLFNRAPMCLPCNQAKARAELALAVENAARAKAAAAAPKPRPMPAKKKAKPTARPLAWKGKAHKRSFEPLRAWRPTGRQAADTGQDAWA